ncbi:unnamed protein product [Fraxinus pennsylvanica]|uniref:DNA-directed RNA polymerase n=1 Tax=Fraxinus pennsylvanica TaxID=56036 RepID=A0AAD2DS33_9LAMI|nr:unnamed protein product [Fraxinus pennsylvanica]
MCSELDIHPKNTAAKCVKEMEESTSSTIFDAKITGIRFAMATRHEICKASISDCPISHASQLSNPFLGLPLEAGRCESCGTAEPGQCEGHFGYIEFPTPVYHPDHVGELKRMLSLLCLKCLKMKNRKVKNIGVAERVLSSCCEETSLISINEVRTTDGACFLELKIPSRSVREGFWNFLEKYGFRYGRSYSRALLPSEVMEILKKIPKETRKKLDAKGYFPQDGYILQHLPVPPNCLSVPDVSDGISTMSTDYSITLLKKVLKQVEAAVAQYFHFRGTGKASRDVDTPATAMSNPAYKAVLDSSSSSNSSWEMMKEMLLCGVNFKNDTCDRRIMLYLNDCDCGRKYCQEKAASMVKTHLTKFSLMDASVDFLIEYRLSEIVGSEIGAGLVGHLHLDKLQLIQSNISMNDILEKCQDTINLCQKKKKVGNLFKRIDLSFSNCCSFRHSAESKSTDIPCLQFFWIGANDDHLERISHILADTVCPVLLETIIKGDPMVLAANIIWINSDATSSRSHSKNQKGELALDIILEKKAVRKSGDAWRVVMDSCLPVIHLIDIKRSIPYAVKQVQELLGISCAFEQAVQRLSTSVTMVTKGVLKDHLLLLANSMTCGGNLIGFNAGGIKSLSRSLNLQVPFMEATLFTPRKCFERAAEKCHVDALTSIVASCSWGKHASVGTGSPFEILWDTRKAELNQQNGLNVYDFLHLVSSSSKQENMGTSCLGEEIDYLDQEDEYMESDLSPVRDSGIEKPTFEDGDNFSLEENEWVQTSSITGKSSSNWEQVKKVESPTRSGWGIEREREDDDLGGSWGKVVEKVKNSTPSGWGVDKGRKDDTFSEKVPKDSPKNNRSAWGKKVDSAEKWSTEEAEQSTWASANASKSSSQSSWGQVVEKVQSTTPGWGFDKGKKDDTFFQKAPEDSPTNRSAWGKKVDFVEKGPTENAEQSTWASANASKSSGQSSWGQAVEKVQSSTPGWGVDRCKKDDTVSKKAPEDSPKNSRSAWGKKVDSVENGPTEKAEQSTWASANASKSSGQSYWGKDVRREDGSPTQTQEYQSVSFSAWGKKQDSEGKGWMEKDDQNNWSSASTPTQKGHSNWVRSSGEKDWSGKDDRNTLVNAGTPKSSSQSGWGRESDEAGWNKKKDQGRWAIPSAPKDNNQSSWGRDAAQMEDVIPAKAQEDSKRATDWDTLGSDSGQDGSGSWSSWGKKIAKSDEIGKKSDRLISSADGDSIDVLHSNENLWEAKVADHGNQSKPSAWGASNDGGKVDSQSPREQKKDSPVSTWNPTPKESNDSGFAPRRHFAGRGDSNRGRGRGRSGGDWKNNRGRGRSSGRGDFSDDFNTLGTFTVTRQRMDLFTVDEQDILSDVEAIMKNIRRIMNQTGYNDGDPISGDDQSYMVDNVLNYHPDKAAKMGAGLKYIMVSRHQEFQDSEARTPGWKRDRTPAANEAGTPCWGQDRTPAPEEAGTPGWCQERTPAAEESGTQGWNTDRSTPAQDEAGTPGWNTGRSTPARDEAGTPGWNAGCSTPARGEAENPGWNTDSIRAREEAGASVWNKSGSR